MKAAVYTLGCKLNQCESEALASSFDSRGFFIGTYRDDAEIYIINTCTVTSKAEQKARRIIRKLSSEHPHSAVVVTGCYAQLNREDLELAENVIVVPHDNKTDLNRLPEYLTGLDFSSEKGSLADSVRSFFDKTSSRQDDPDRFWYDSVDFNYHTRAFLKIQDGCDNSCAYCRVTIARGDSVSLDSDSVLRQFNRLQSEGFREVVLTGVNLSSYKSGEIDFTDLLENLSNQAFRTRIRLSSLEPETIDSRMAGVIRNEMICSHFHIPVQSGSDRILSLMMRHNNRDRIIRAVDALRSAKDDPFMAADVIAGFPGETDEDFEQTRSLLSECDFTHLHVFPFSARPGTAAFDMKHKVPERIAAERTKILRQLSEENFARYKRRQTGRVVEVLIEEERDGFQVGTSGNYLKSAICDIIKEGSGVCRAEVLADDSPGNCGNGSFSSETLACKFIEWT
ncbi:MAG: tRNA (N(6)-L-threonylcarbamoyladenosine(37)-C(2))-methylthiotransferase MtaB [Spirochaetales bacterium]|nr:tRNA (N(6)-L-threonylcarbamoyladenosine(37)-C(2))-methylthiotransferase MtaB [Spirochaetales bacterium]